jgi:cellulose synthase/poly-beta-1,6-N-acetylglucosamine synthase-like glycosyltransferase
MPHSATVTVIIPTFSLDRWDQLVEAVSSVEAQTCPPLELIVCVDHNTELLRRCTERWADRASTAGFPILVVPNRFAQGEEVARRHQRAHGSIRRFGAGWNRNTGAELARGEIIAFMDDDAAAAPTWLEYLRAPFADPHTAAVGGAPLPNFETGRPRWFPANFDWVFGCAYAGLPTELGPYPRLIGANMAVRTEAFVDVGGCHSIDFDDLDLCLRLSKNRRLLYEPRAVVYHLVPEQRVTWHYFWRRCFVVNREKVEVFVRANSQGGMGAESRFVARALTAQLRADVNDILHGRLDGAARIAAMLVGIVMASLGNLVGRCRWVVSPREPVSD